MDCPTQPVTAPGGTFHGTVNQDSVNQDSVNQATATFHSLRYSHIPDPFTAPAPLDYSGEVDATTPRPDDVALSIRTPYPLRQELPVMVYIHGGRFETGTHADLPQLAGDYVLVKIGYRVGLPGLLRFSSSAPEDNYFRYRAIDDVAQGLEWVQRNIESFGGDPTNVTVIGQSAGATIALWLCRRDHYRGAFRRVLALSPCFPRDPFEARAATLRAALGIPLTRESLRALPPQRLARGYAALRKKYRFDIALGPYPLNPEDFANIPIVVTSTRQEFANLGARYDASPARYPLAYLLAPRFGMRRQAVRTWANFAQPGVVGQLISDSCIRRWVQQVAVGAPGPTWMLEFVRQGQPALHCQELDPLFAPGPLNDWLQEFARTGQPGFTPFGPEHAVLRWDLDTATATLTHGALDYVEQAFSED
ncbi:carboxylesterase family protein [Corynebacterium lizhenjunii]|uniref:carboxylesterase family protein n=1 Tax=Corynebacterium lizhenjunii TaxID=2709394 RepID=UPI0013EC38FF|nr:carboxylesterase family protein [Corynebacterium lizhenjunii]